MHRNPSSARTRAGTLTLLSLAILGLALAAAPGAVSGQEAERATVLGRFTLDEPATRVQTRIERAIDRSIQDMNALIRGIARRRLAEYTPVVRNVRLAVHGDVIAVSLDGRTVRGNADGSEREVTTPTGDEALLTSRLQGARLTQSFVFDQGTRRHVFTRRPDGKLVLQVSMGSEQLPAPVSYAMRFRPSRR